LHVSVRTIMSEYMRMHMLVCLCVYVSVSVCV